VLIRGIGKAREHSWKFLVTLDDCRAVPNRATKVRKSSDPRGCDSSVIMLQLTKLAEYVVRV
jgi:hypothetical protein